MVGRCTPPLSPIAISKITTMALYIVGSLQDLRLKLWYLYTTNSMASSVLISSSLSLVSSTQETSTIATLCGSTTSSISNMLHSHVNC